MANLRVTKQNYYSNEADRAYWSASQVKAFLDCPERAMAELNGTYQRESSTALLVGNFVDSYFEGAKYHQQFINEHPELFKRDGTLKAEFVKATEMIDRIEKDKNFMSYMKGQKQKIITGELFGLPFKCKLDVYKKGKYIVDLKTVRDFEPLYKPEEGKLHPIAYWHWDMQLAIYQALEGSKLPCYIAAVTKEDPPALHLVQIDQSVLDMNLDYLKEKMPLLDAMKQGVVEAERCESCAYCRGTKQIREPEIYTGI